MAKVLRFKIWSDYLTDTSAEPCIDTENVLLVIFSPCLAQIMWLKISQSALQ